MKFVMFSCRCLFVRMRREASQKPEALCGFPSRLEAIFMLRLKGDVNDGIYI